MLCLPRNLHFEVHKVLHLPRNLHFEVHQVLCLPRNLHFKVHKVLWLPRNLHFEVHKVLWLPRNPHIEGHRMRCLPRNLHIEGHRVLCLPRNLQTSHISKSHDSLHLSRNLSSSTITTMSKVLRLPRNTKTAFRFKTAPIPGTCHEKSTLEHQNARFPLRLPRKVTTIYQRAHGTTTRAQSLEAPAAGRQILQAGAVEVHMDDVKNHECTVNSSELAGHGRALQRSKHQLLFLLP